MSMPRVSEFVCMCALLLAAVAQVSAHAALRIPAGRNWLDSTEYNKGGNNGRGADGGAICGDGGQNKPQFGKRGPVPPQNRFVAGEKIEVDVWLQHSHKGRMEFRICEFEGAETTATLNQACLDKHVLVPDPSQSRVYKGHWWLGAYTYEAGTVESVKIKYTLPSDLNCDGVRRHCVMQMTYMNGNSCNPPGEDCPTAPPTNCFPPEWNMVKCDVRVHERFRNCADIIVTGRSGGYPAPTTKPPTTKPPTTKPPTTKPPTTKPPTTKPPKGSSCCKNKSDGYHKNGNSCSRICLCRGGKTAKKLKCKDGHSFDFKTKKCRPSQYVRC